jgi:hypothetical protein
MMPTYRYTGDVPTVFIGLQKDGVTWTPSKGDEITVEVPVGHPWLERVKDVVDEKVPEKVAKPAVPATPDATPDTKTQ